MFTVFQPHRYSRTQAMYEDFAKSLADGGRVMLVELYPAFEKPIPGVSAHLIEEAMQRQGMEPLYASSIDEALEILKREVHDEDMLLIMGAGNVRRLSERFTEWKKENAF